MQGTSMTPGLGRAWGSWTAFCFIGCQFAQTRRLAHVAQASFTRNLALRVKCPQWGSDHPLQG